MGRCNNMGMIFGEPEINDILKYDNEIHCTYVGNDCQRDRNSQQGYFFHFGGIGIPKQDSNCTFDKFQSIFQKKDYMCSKYAVHDLDKHFPSLQTVYSRNGRFSKSIPNPYVSTIGVDEGVDPIQLYRSKSYNKIHSVHVGDTIQVRFVKEEEKEKENETMYMYFKKNNQYFLILEDMNEINHEDRRKIQMMSRPIVIKNGIIRLDCQKYYYYIGFLINRCFCENNQAIQYEFFIVR